MKLKNGGIKQIKMIRVVFCVIHNDRGEILLQKKTADYPAFPGMWSLLGGTAESDDFEEETRREMIEEIGIKIPLKSEFNLDFEESERHAIRKFYVFSGNLNDISKLSIGEGAGIAFFGKDELKDIKITPVCNQIIKLFLDKNKESK